MNEIIEPTSEAEPIEPTEDAAADAQEAVPAPSEADEGEDEEEDAEDEEAPQSASATPAVKKRAGKRKRTLDIPQSIMDGLAVSPVEYLRKWWMANSTEEERIAAEERDATVEGAYAFIEDFSRRAKKHNGGACLPDQLVYDLCGIFMRICRDGDVYATAEEIAKDEEAEKKRKLDEAKRKAEAEKRREQAARKEAERVAAMSPEEREAYERELANRSEREREAAAKAEAERRAREAAERAKREKREAAARKKALAEEMKKRQLTFF